MRTANLAERFAATQTPATPSDAEVVAGLLASVQSIRLQLDETTQAVNRALTASNEFMAGVEKINDRSITPAPDIYVDYETFSRLLTRVSAIQDYLISVQQNLPTVLVGINEVPK